jgi:small-conductance mechanosensitive channel
MEKSKNTRTQSPRSVAPDKYHTDVARDIVFAKVITRITDEHINSTTEEDRHLITLREFLVNSDNASLHEYVRDVRELLISLRQQYIDVNNEMKSTLRVQSKLEKCLDELRKDSVVNNACSQLRELRPRREKDLGANDQIDDLLKQERTKQQFLKKNLQELLQSTIAQVNELSESRNMLYKVIEEREKVCGYINCSVAGVEYRKMMLKKRQSKKAKRSRTIFKIYRVTQTQRTKL